MPKGYSNGLPLKPPVSKKGKYQPLASLETRNKMSEVAKNNGFGKWMKGKKLSKEWIENRTKSQSGENHYNWRGVYTGNQRVKTLEILSKRKKPEICDLCGDNGRICFDHDHITGKFRGWLCHNCNVTLGLVKENTDLLVKMVAYILDAKNNNDN